MQIEGALEIDHERGVIYFHSKESGLTMFRICRLPNPIPKDTCFVDVTNGVGVSYTRDNGRVGEEQYLNKPETDRTMAAQWLATHPPQFKGELLSATQERHPSREVNPVADDDPLY